MIESITDQCVDIPSVVRSTEYGVCLSEISKGLDNEEKESSLQFLEIMSR